MTEIGYALSSEEHPPNDLVANAKLAEEAGFTFALISDHFHPWADAQGQSPFVWSVIGGIAQATERIRLGTGVTCPLIRTHPAIVAHAAATCAAMMPGRFFLGVGTGENLNEHVLGDRWPAPDERVDMLEEAIEVMRLLWQGGYQTHRGRFYTVEGARLYTVPDHGVEVYVAAGAQRIAEVAGRLGDGLIAVEPDEDVVKTFDENGSGDRPKIGMAHGCWAASEDEALDTAYEVWPQSGLKGPLNQDLRLPADFEAASEVVKKEDLRESIPLGPDPKPWLEEIKGFVDAGYTHVYIHQIGRDQQGFVEFAREHLLPAFA